MRLAQIYAPFIATFIPDEFFIPEVDKKVDMASYLMKAMFARTLCANKI